MIWIASILQTFIGQNKCKQQKSRDLNQFLDRLIFLKQKPLEAKILLKSRVARGQFFEQASRYDFARTQQCWDSD